MPNLKENDQLDNEEVETLEVECMKLCAADEQALAEDFASLDVKEWSEY